MFLMLLFPVSPTTGQSRLEASARREKRERKNSTRQSRVLNFPTLHGSHAGKAVEEALVSGGGEGSSERDGRGGRKHFPGEVVASAKEQNIG